VDGCGKSGAGEKYDERRVTDHFAGVVDGSGGTGEVLVRQSAYALGMEVWAAHKEARWTNVPEMLPGTSHWPTIWPTSLMLVARVVHAIFFHHAEAALADVLGV
jgi:hypothetical protein